MTITFPNEACAITRRSKVHLLLKRQFENNE